MAKKPLPSPEVLRQLLTYDPATGDLVWRTRHAEMFPTKAASTWWNGRFANQKALTAIDSSGYRFGLIFSVTHKAHRVIWALYYGAWPRGEIDHLNGIKTDNRIKNLRDVHKSVNARNTKMYGHNTSGQNGVSWYRRNNKWRASIKIDGQQKHLGYFECFDDAIAARKAAEKGHGFTDRHGR